MGDVYDPTTGRIVAGARNKAGLELSSAREALLQGMQTNLFLRPQNTTLGVVAANLGLNKVQAAMLARMAQSGLARTIFPVHTPVDGDTVFALSTYIFFRDGLFECSHGNMLGKDWSARDFSNKDN